MIMVTKSEAPAGPWLSLNSDGVPDMDRCPDPELDLAGRANERIRHPEYCADYQREVVVPTY
jgi:hypothetical protein